MTKFYTGRGDEGKSAMAGREIPKSDLLFWALGGLDELNSWLGFCKVEANRKLKKVAKALKNIQENLFIAQAELAASAIGRSGKIKISGAKIKELERLIDEIDLQLPPITKFIIPGGSELAARLDVARTLARNAERQVTAYSLKKRLNPELMRYLNRLSSLLFALARFANHQLGIEEENPSYR